MIICQVITRDCYERNVLLSVENGVIGAVFDRP